MNLIESLKAFSINKNLLTVYLPEKKLNKAFGAQILP